MLDRESTFADPQIIAWLKDDFVPVAFDQWYVRRQQDAAGDFYRKIAGQGPRNNFESTTQGFYLATPSGKLLAYNNNRGPWRIRNLMQQALEQQPAEFHAEPIKTDDRDEQFTREPPPGTVVVQVNAKVLGGYSDSDSTTNNRAWREIFQNAISRDNLWITQGEQRSLAKGSFPTDLARRLARFHLVDNTRGEPPMWKLEEIKTIQMTVDDQGHLRGSVHLETASGQRGFVGVVWGQLKMKDDRLTQFDLVAKGRFWGQGRYTEGAPRGKFPFAVAFRLAAGDDVADQVAPQGTKGWLDDYLGR